MDEFEWAQYGKCEVYDLSGSGVVSDAGQCTQVFCCSPKVKDRTIKKSSPYLLPFQCWAVATVASYPSTLSIPLEGVSTPHPRGDFLSIVFRGLSRVCSPQCSRLAEAIETIYVTYLNPEQWWFCHPSGLKFFGRYCP